MTSPPGTQTPPDATTVNNHLYAQLQQEKTHLKANIDLLVKLLEATREELAANKKKINPKKKN